MNSLKGQLLVATTQLLDPNFARTVVLILEHNDEGAVGVILNRPTQARVTDLAGQGFEESTDWEKPIHLGGPVAGTVLVLHEVEELSDVEILPGVYSTAEASKIQQLIRSQAEPSLILANYAGWRAGQLETEIEEDSWLTCPATPRHVFSDDPAELWESLVREINAAELTRMLGLRDVPDDPTLN